MKTHIFLTLMILGLIGRSQIIELKQPTNPDYFKSINFTSNGNFLTASGYESTILFDLKTLKPVRSYVGGMYSSCSPDDKYITSGSIVYDMLTGKKVFVMDKSSYKLTFSPNGKYIASLSSKDVVLSKASDGKLIRTFKEIKKDNGDILIRFTPDSKYIIVSDGFNRLFTLVVETGEILNKYLYSFSRINDFCITNDSKNIYALNKDSVLVWNLERGTFIKTFAIEKNTCAIDISKDNTFFITLGVEKGYGPKNIYLRKTLNGELTKTISTKEHLEFAKLTYDNNYVVAISPDSKFIWIYDLATGDLVKKYAPVADWIYMKTKEKEDEYFLFRQGGKIFLMDHSFKRLSDFELDGNSEKMVYQKSNNKIYAELNGNIEVISPDHGEIIKSLHIEKSLSACKFSADGNYMAYYDSKGSRFNIFSTQTGDIIIEHDLNPNKKSNCRFSINFSDDSKYIASAYPIIESVQNNSTILSIKHQIQIRDLLTKSIIKSFNITTQKEGFIDALKFSKDNRFIYTLGNNDGVINRWDLEGNLTKTYQKGSFSFNVEYSNDGKYYLVGQNDGTYIYESANDKFVRKVVSAQYFSKDNKYLYAIEGNRIDKRLFSTGELLISYYFIGKNDWVATTPNGFFDGTPNGLKELYYVKGLDIIPLESTFEQFYTPNLTQRVNAGEKLLNTVNLSQLQQAPEVKILSPNNNSNLSSNNIVISVQVKDNGGGIDEVQLFHNGKLVETTNRGFKSIPSNNIQKFTITLVDGVNILKATAFNNQRTEAIPDVVQVNFSGQKATSNLFLFVIGINNYKNPKNKLNYALADASSFKTSIENGSKEIFDIINTTFLTDQNATKNVIIDAFNSIKLKIKPEDVFVFYYAGHGVMSEETKSKFYLIPYDVVQLYGDNESLKSLAISSEELQKISMEIKAQKQLFILDACQSGGMVELLASRGSAEQKAIAQLARSTGTYWLTASNSEQFATEFSALGHGLFTYTLLQGLSGQASLNREDKKITVEQLSSFIKNMLPELSIKYKGEAQYPNSYGYGNDFPIVIAK